MSVLERSEEIRSDGRHLTYYRGQGPLDKPAPPPEAVSERPWILVTGGAGYVGSACVRALAGRGLDVVVLDDLSTGYADSLPDGVRLVTGEAGDLPLVEELLGRTGLRAVFHFAARTEVAASVRDPLEYYRVNVEQSLRLVRAVAARRVPFIFSSSAAVYGMPETAAVAEDAALRPVNPYGETKRVIEAALAHAEAAYGLRWIALRYFNAAGAITGASGAPAVRERHAPESHLIPNVLAAALGGPPVALFGTDYPTPDGTALRDYAHVADLAEGHLLALDHLERGGSSGPFNLGSGRPTSVREALAVAERVVGRPIPHTTAGRRSGDPPVLVADVERARTVLGYRPERSTIERVVADAWQALGSGEAV